jgi:putative endonuclease
MLALLRKGWTAFRSLFSPENGGPHTARLGRRGERAAARHLRRRGYRILERNFRVTEGEIDLVAFRDGVLAFVEVRSRTRPEVIDPAETVTRRKQRRVIKAAQAYMAEHGLTGEPVAARFDLVTVLFSPEGRCARVNHLEGAFQESPRGFT